MYYKKKDELLKESIDIFLSPGYFTGKGKTTKESNFLSYQIIINFISITKE